MTGKPKAKTYLSTGERRLGALSLICLALIFGLFHIITIDSAIIAQGQVVVQGKPRPVQSLEGGVVSDIRVRDGDEVTAGQVVVQLDPTLALINREIIRGRLAELVAREIRIEAELEQSDRFPPLIVESHLDAETVRKHLSGQYELFKSRRAVLENQNGQLNERKLQYEAQIRGLEAQIQAGQEQVDLITREVGNLEALFKQGLVQESRLLELQGRKAGLLGQMALHQSEVARMRNSIRDAELKITQTEREFREEVVAESREVSTKINENMLELARTVEATETELKPIRWDRSASERVQTDPTLQRALLHLRGS